MANATVQSVLRAALARLGDNGEHWTRNSLARTADGSGCSVSSPDAASWCAWGAVLASYIAVQVKAPGTVLDGLSDAMLDVAKAAGYDNIIEYNDDDEQPFQAIRDAIADAAGEAS